MSSKLKEIHEYWISKGNEEEQLLKMDTSSVYLSMEIAEYAHKDQKRENGEDYANHPARVLFGYRNLVGIVPDDLFCIDKDLMWENGIPYEGVQELCCLHDVVEDSELSFDDVKDIFYDCGFQQFFNLNIKFPLILITHDKSESQDIYIEKCMKHPTSALVKMLDLQDNSDVFSFTSFDKDKYERTQRNLKFMYIINSRFDFIENAQKYLEAFAKENNKK